MWITDKDTIHNENTLYYFKRQFSVHGSGTAVLAIRVSARARYKLYFNGEQVSLGPCKGNDIVTYYEPLDLSGKLVEGENILLAKVLQLEEENGVPSRISSVMSRGDTAFFWTEF